MTADHISELRRLDELRVQSNTPGPQEFMNARRARFRDACDFTNFAAIADELEALQRENAELRRSLSAICASYPQRQQMLPHVRRAMDHLSAECQNCGTVTLPWEGHAPCNPVLPQLLRENAELRARLHDEACDQSEGT
jgi:hypothetical protein